MTLSLEQLSSRMRRGEDIPLRETAQVVLALSVPSILQQMVDLQRDLTREIFMQMQEENDDQSED